MYTVIVILILVVSVLLGLVVLVQNSKGGGLASEFSSSNQIMGVRRTSDFLEKTTWTLAIVLVVLSFITCFMGRSTYQKKSEGGSKAQQGQSAAAPIAQPAATAVPEAATPVETAPEAAE